jgi:hypothetical protein
VRTRIVLPLLAAIAAVAITACQHAFRAGVLSVPAGAPPEVAVACQLASDRCARCHPLARVELARVDSPQHWEWYVSRMRMQPRSGIAEEEQPTIVRCLVARTFGLAAADRLPR